MIRGLEEAEIRGTFRRCREVAETGTNATPYSAIVDALEATDGRRWCDDAVSSFERRFAHALEAGGMRRIHPRKCDNLLERLLVHGDVGDVGLRGLRRATPGFNPSVPDMQPRAQLIRSETRQRARINGLA